MNRCNFNLLWHQNTIGASIFKMGAKKMKKVQKELIKIQDIIASYFKITPLFTIKESEERVVVLIGNTTNNS